MIGDMAPGLVAGREGGAFYEVLPDKRLRCLVCVRNCLLSPGQEAPCKARKNDNGRMLIPAAFPLSNEGISAMRRLRIANESPDDKVLILGGWGCNLSCRMCLNHELSYRGAPLERDDPEAGEVLENAAKKGVRYVAFSVTEPLIHVELLTDLLAHAKRLSFFTVVCTNAAFHNSVFKEIFPFTDAFRVGIKGLSDRAYEEICGIGVFEDVVRSISLMVSEGKRLFMEFLLIPGVNDNPVEIRQGLRAIADTGASCAAVNLLRFIPSSAMGRMVPASNMDLARAKALFEQQGFIASLEEV